MGYAAYHPDPVARYLRELPGAPVGFKPPTTVWPLFERVPGGGRGRYAHKPTPAADAWWDAHLKTDPSLREWLRSDKSFVAPDSWPEVVEELLPDQVTPRAFALAVMPDREDTDRGGLLHNCPQLDVLSAYAHGWPVPIREWPLMVEAAQWLIRNPLFVIWAYDLDVSVLPLPFTDTSLEKRLRARAELIEDPLALGRNRMYRALAKNLRDPDILVSLLPRRSDGVGPSTRQPRLRP